MIRYETVTDFLSEYGKLFIRDISKITGISYTRIQKICKENGI